MSKDVEKYLDSLNLARLERERQETLFGCADPAPVTFSRGRKAPNISIEDAYLYSVDLDSEDLKEEDC